MVEYNEEQNSHTAKVIIVSPVTIQIFCRHSVVICLNNFRFIKFSF